MNSFWNGKRRYIALLLFLAGVFVALEVPPVIPFIQLPGENLPEGYNIPFTEMRITNTLVAAVSYGFCCCYSSFISRGGGPATAAKYRRAASTICSRRYLRA